MGYVGMSDHSGAEQIDSYLKRLFPITRSITGEGNRETLRILRELIPLKILEFPSGKQVYGWTIPDEWNLKDAWIKDKEGNRLIDIADSNLHVVGYSASIHRKIAFEDLKSRLFYLEQLPEAIPYRTTYYKRDWGFCVTKKQYLALEKEKDLEIFIDATFDSEGSLSIGELIIPGKSEQEVLISTYICHPSLANDNLSGPVLAAFLAQEMLKGESPNHTWRIIFVPETIGAITYCAEHEEIMKKITSGLVVTTVGGPGKIGYKQSHDASHPINSMIEDLFKEKSVDYITYPFDFHGSDERQYSSIGFRINTASITKDKYYEYPYYHTSLDNLDFVKGEYICETLSLYREVVSRVDKDIIFRNRYPNGEVMLAKFGLYPEDGGGLHPGMAPDEVLDIRMELLFSLDGTISIGRLAKKIGCSIDQAYNECVLLEKYSVIERIPEIRHRLIMSASDAGPAEYIARIAKGIDIPYRIYASKVSEPIFHKHGIGCILGEHSEDDHADLIVTGTHKGEGIDKALVRWGKTKGIPTLSVVEHWTFMADRFLADGNFVLPDKILLNDVWAHEQLKAARIPEDLGLIVGNPILEEEEIEDGSISRSWDETYDEHLAAGAIVFISEELASAFPEDSKDYPGFDEYTVLHDLLTAIPENRRVVVKLHPEERQDKFRDIQKEFLKKEVIIVKESNTAALLESAEVVVGMGSMLLLEAAKTRRDILSYRPNEYNHFIGNEMGVTKLVNNIAELREILGGDKVVENELVGRRFAGSAEKIRTVIEGYIYPSP